jgi:hypothetical protein
LGFNNTFAILVRGDLTVPHLILYSDILILPGCNLRPWAGARGYPHSNRWTLVTGACGLGVRRAGRLAMRCLPDLAAEVRWLLERQRYHWRLRWNLWHRRTMCHGSVRSLREELAVGGPIVHPNAVQDVIGTVAFLQQVLNTGLRTYLEEHGIDTSALDDQMQPVVHSHQTRIEQLHAKNVAFGEQSRAGDDPPTG